MKYEDVEVGMKVRVSDDISETHRRFDSNSDMRSMRGHICEVKELTEGRRGVHVFNPVSGDIWTFCAGDLSPLTIHKKPKPVTFDPKNIDA